MKITGVVSTVLAGAALVAQSAAADVPSIVIKVSHALTSFWPTKLSVLTIDRDPSSFTRTMARNCKPSTTPLYLI